VYDLGSQDASGTLAEQLALSSGERLSLKKSVANPKEILEPEDFTFQIFHLPRTSSEVLCHRNKYPLLGVRFSQGKKIK
jgi:hypothetical protein